MRVNYESNDMKVLIISDIGTLNMLQDQAEKVADLYIVDKNALLYDDSAKEAWVNLPRKSLEICFGYYYSYLTENDNRFVGKGDWFDFLVEIGSNKMCFLAEGSKYINLPVCHSITKVLEVIKDVSTEEGRCGSGCEVCEGEECGRSEQVDHGS
jgi:hypothetical protein